MNASDHLKRLPFHKDGPPLLNRPADRRGIDKKTPLSDRNLSGGFYAVGLLGLLAKHVRNVWSHAPQLTKVINLR